MSRAHLNKIYNRDCIYGMDDLIRSGIEVDLIVADPPYVISRGSNFHTMKIARTLGLGLRLVSGMRSLITASGLKDPLVY